MKSQIQKPNLKIQKALTKFGLTENEIAVYLATLVVEETSPFAIAKQTGIPRTTVYDVLMSLSLKNLIELHQSDGFSKQQTRIKAKNPSVLRKILQDRRKEMMSTEVDIVEILPFLKGEYHGVHNNADFQFFPGIEGAKKVYLRQFSRSPRRVWENMMPMDVFGITNMNQLTDQETIRNTLKGIDHKELIALTDWTKHVISYQNERDDDYLYGRQIRYIDNPFFDNKLHITLQDSRVYIACAHEEEIWGLIIKSQTLYNTLSSIFDVLWMNAVPLTPEIVKSWGKNEFLAVERGK